MISACPNCGKTLNLTEGQREKIDHAVSALPPGKSLKFNCPHCHKPIEMQREDREEVRQPGSRHSSTPAGHGLPEPPGPPDRSWLERGDLGSGEVLEDVPQVMILVKNEQIQADIVQYFDDMGYKAVMPRTPEDAIERMRFINFSAVVLHSGFEGNLAESTVHAYMQGMSMPKRRYIYYVLIGPEFSTLYNLEALSNSANLVINEADISAFPLVLKKGFRDYDELFGPYLAALAALGKR
ncbi:MAG: hypothetical protein KKC76_09660 [Proteobacteria bacterium]|nr:hypothetical protein [Pseudomonadota bacterium]MBU4296841.1 hypothetical protein [Pseudomonadota bacterium]MCG2748979.1 hypothetical protein [Desulfobulbaceae bacterium]